MSVLKLVGLRGKGKGRAEVPIPVLALLLPASHLSDLQFVITPFPLLFTQELNLDILLLSRRSSSLQEEAAGLAPHLSFCSITGWAHPPAFLPPQSLLSRGEGRKSASRKRWVLYFPRVAPCIFPGCLIRSHLSIHNPWCQRGVPAPLPGAD